MLVMQKKRQKKQERVINNKTMFFKLSKKKSFLLGFGNVFNNGKISEKHVAQKIAETSK